MARTLNITAPAAQTESLLQDLQGVEGLLALEVYRGASVMPPGDVISLAVPNSCLNQVMRVLDQHKLGKAGGISLSSSSPAGYIPTQSSRSIERDNNQATWEEMEMTMSSDSNTSLNTLLVMFTAGALAVVGLTTNALHIVIGGMLLAPGFMPITRVALGVVTRHKSWYFGLIDFARGYLALMVGAAVMAMALMAFGYDPITTTTSYFTTEQKLIGYWSSVTTPSLLGSAVAAVAGALLVATKRSVFTSGVMIGLALVPTASVAAVAVIDLDFVLALKALIRFALDVVLVFVCSLAVFVWVRLHDHKRDIQLSL